ncbi:MAG: hypothetical protein ACM3XM_04340 [Mycobacterium leprae]
MDRDNQNRAGLQGEHRLTEVELHYLREAMDAEVLHLKKCLHYAQEVQDENARSLFTEHADIHHRRVDMMLALLDSTGDITKHAKLLLQSAGTEGGERYV